MQLLGVGWLILLPWPTLSASAAALHPDELDRQYLAAIDAYVTLEANVPSKDPAVVMWRGCQGALLFWLGELARQMPPETLPGSTYADAWLRAYRRSEMVVGPLPWWLGNADWHRMCQSVLIQEDLVYARQFPHAPLAASYCWPTNKEGLWAVA